MAKTQKPSDDEKIVKENVEKRFKNMFTGENEPLSNMSLKEVAALKARIAELETLVADQQAASDSKSAVAAEEPAVPSLPLVPVEKIRTDRQASPASGALEKFIGLWVTGISAATGLASLGVSLYFVFVLQRGMMELSDKILMPFTVLMVIANLIGLRLVRHDRPLPGVWISYLTNVIAGSVLVVLTIKDLQFLMGGYLALFSLLFITLVLPKRSRWWASLAGIGAALIIAGIQIWDPDFRVSLGNIQNYTAMILGPATLGFFLLFIIVRQLRYPQSTRSLTAVLSITFFALSAVLLLVNGGMAAFTNYMDYRESQSAKQLLIAQDAGKTVANFIQEQFRVLETAVQVGDPVVEDPETRENVVGGVLGLQPAFRQAVLLNPRGQQLAGISRQAQSLSPQFASNLTEEVVVRTKDGQRFISNIYIDDVTNEPQVVIAVPVRNTFGDYLGTLAVELNLKFMWDLVDQLKVGETGYAYVVDWHGNLIASGDTSRVLRGENVKQISEVQEFLKDPWYQTSDITPGLDSYKGLLGENVVGTYVPLVTPVWAVVIELPTKEAYQPIMRSLLTTSLMILIFGILAGLAGIVLARRLSAPLTELSKVATEISSGNLSLQAKVGGPTEIAQVASTFNSMTRQLHDLIGSLERRVSDRTHDLELAAEVGRTVTEKVTQLSEMLSEAAEMIRARFDLYYTQIYLIDPMGERINLRAGTGEVGKELLQRGYSLPVNPGSLNGRAAVEKRVQIVADTRENPAFLPNPLLPNTRSEMCIPLIANAEVVGVLDMQSDQPGALSESNLPAFEALAGQLAIVIRNATLFMEAEEARAEMEAQVKRSTEAGWQEVLNAIQKGHRVGFAFRDGQVTRLQPEALSISPSADGLNMPIAMTGAKIGAIHIPANLKTNELELVKSVGEQLAQHIENLRLLAQAELYRAEAEQAVRRLTHEGWDSFLRTHEDLRQGYLFDLTEVKPLSEASEGSSDQTIKHAMAIGKEIIGELAADTPNQSDANEVIAAVAEQLSAHIESLRLSELNEKHAQREQTLRQITSALRSSNDPATILRTAVREVGTLMGRRALVQVVHPEQANQRESAPGNANKTDLPADRS